MELTGNLPEVMANPVADRGGAFFVANEEEGCALMINHPELRAPHLSAAMKMITPEGV